jgi:nicotinate phosphoribosyltransferase
MSFDVDMRGTTGCADGPAGLFTDLYELRMAASYAGRGMEESATFSLFVRDLPPRRGFLVAGGLVDALAYLEAFAFDEAALAWLERAAGFSREARLVLGDLRFTGDVFAVPEGRVVLAEEPLLEVTAPLPQAQAVETGLLNALTYATAVASKAARCRLAADGAGLIDFAARRAPGREAARTVARVSALVGFAGTSDVEAARRFGLRAVGTMAHSYVEAFGSDRDAFRAFAADFPDAAVFLVDTYDNAEGVRAAVQVIAESGLEDRAGIRLDSGDMASLARDARRVLNEAGLPKAQIMASGGLDEDAIADLVERRAPIDSYAVGTRMAMSADAPSLDSAYKLVEYAGRAKMKLSSGKCTLPGAKQVFRDSAGCLRDDVLGLRDEPALAGDEPLLVPVMYGGRRTAEAEWAVDPLAARERFAADLARLPGAARRLGAPEAPRPRHSPALKQLRTQTVRELEVGLERAGAGSRG